MKLIKSLVGGRESSELHKKSIDYGGIIAERKKLKPLEGKGLRQPIKSEEQIALEKLEHSKYLSGQEYEIACANLLRVFGWTVQDTPASGDHGVDLIAEYSGVRVAIQCKKYNSGSIGNKAVQEIISGRLYTGADYGIVVGTAEYTPKAYELASVSQIQLLHHKDLSNLHERFGLTEGNSHSYDSYWGEELTPETLYELALDALNDKSGATGPKEYVIAHDRLKRAATSGHADAQFALGQTYHHGLGTQKNINEAVIWWEKAASQGNASAELLLYVVYWEGTNGLEANKSKAVEWLQRSAKSGAPEAEYQLGLLYWKGDHVPQSDAEAFRLLYAASYKGLMEAKLELSKFYSSGRHVSKDLSMAQKLLTEAAEGGLVDAQYGLGLFALNQSPPDVALGQYWFHEAARQQHPEAERSLGDLYSNDDFVMQDLPKAAHWFEVAAGHGDIRAQHALGLMHLLGAGVAQNEKVAFTRICESANAGHPEAQNALGVLYATGTGIEKDEKAAFYWISRSAAERDSSAEINMGLMHYHGFGTPQDREKAIHWLRRALEDDNQEAQEILEKMEGGGSPAFYLLLPQDLVKQPVVE